jgi:hypothetical protein
LHGRLSNAHNGRMGKRKTKKPAARAGERGRNVEWRGKSFNSDEELISYAEERVLELLRSPVTVTEGDETQFLALRAARLDVKLSQDQPRPRKRPIVSPPAVLAKQPKPLPPLRLPKTKSYFS